MSSSALSESLGVTKKVLILKKAPNYSLKYDYSMLDLEVLSTHKSYGLFYSGNKRLFTGRGGLQ